MIVECLAGFDTDVLVGAHVQVLRTIGGGDLGVANRNLVADRIDHNRAGRRGCDAGRKREQGRGKWKDSECE